MVAKEADDHDLYSNDNGDGGIFRDSETASDDHDLPGVRLKLIRLKHDFGNDDGNGRDNDDDLCDLYYDPDGSEGVLVQNVDQLLVIGLTGVPVQGSGRADHRVQIDITSEYLNVPFARPLAHRDAASGGFGIREDHRRENRRKA